MLESSPMVKFVIHTLLMILQFVVGPTIINNILFNQNAYGQVLRYTDTNGKTHYVSNIEAIPEEYRSQLENSKPLPPISKVPASEASAATGSSSSLNGIKKPARPRKKVEVLVASWCPYCKQLEKYLKENKFNYALYDVEKSAQGKKLFQQWGGGGLPISKVGNQIIKGFNPHDILTAAQ